jgi:hypothetical protein
MKKSLAICAMVALTATLVNAQTTSANIVGYSKITAVGGELSLVAVNFETGGLTVNDIFGSSLPTLSTVYVWDKSSNTYVSSTKGRAGFSPDPTIENGDAMWILAAGSDSNEVIVSGEVDTSLVRSNTLDGIDAVGLGYPVAVNFEDTDLATQAPSLSTLNIWNGSSYNTYTKGRAGWGASGVQIDVSEGFWINTPSQVEWTESRPFTF